MIIDFYNRGGGSGGGVTTGQVQTMIDNSISGKQNYYTVQTYPEITGLTGREGDVVNVVASDEVYPNEREVSPDDMKNFLEYEWWSPLSGKTIMAGFDMAEMELQNVVNILDQYAQESGYVRELTFSADINEGGLAFVMSVTSEDQWAYHVDVDNVEIASDDDWDGSPFAVQIPSAITSVTCEFNAWDEYGEDITNPVELPYFAIRESNLKYHYQNGAWVEATSKSYVDNSLENKQDVVVANILLPDASDYKEGDVCVLSGVTKHMNPSEFATFLASAETLWRTNTTYVFDVDTGMTPSTDFNVQIELDGSDWHIRTLGYSTSDGGWFFDDGNSRTLWSAGTYGDFNIPAVDFVNYVSVQYDGDYEESFTADYTGTTQYQKVDGRWVQPASKEDIDNLSN